MDAKAMTKWLIRQFLGQKAPRLLAQKLADEPLTRTEYGLHRSSGMRKTRYAVVGLGHISQVAILPAFDHAKNSELVALFSNDQKKLKTMGRKYGIKNLYSYDQYDEVLASGEIDAVYIALPNHLHREYTVRAANCGVHVLCEKPMAVTAEDCQEMIRACRENGVKLMVAYRLHFEAANLSAIDVIEKKRLGDARVFESVFTQAVPDDNIRLNPREKGGGPLYDVGIYCINAARYLFQAEPESVSALAANGNERKFKNAEESVSVVMKFSEERIAAFTCSFGTVGESSYRVLGKKGELEMVEPYSYAKDIKQTITINGKEKKKVFKKRDQFGPEVAYFSMCIQKDIEPEPNGMEGLADIHVIEAIYHAIDSGMTTKVESLKKKTRPGLRQEIHMPAIEEPSELVDVQAPSKKTA
jgi:glucose-fructose oxidoreductase